MERTRLAKKTVSDVKNDHVEEDGCLLNSTGRGMMMGNSLGFVSSGDLEIRGGDTLQ